MNRKHALILLSFIAVSLSSVAAEEPAKTLYAQKCSSCHGKNGKGNPAMAKMFKVDPSALDLTSQAIVAKKEEDLMATTAKGRGKMPAYESKLKPEEIKSLVRYIRDFSKPKP